MAKRKKSKINPRLAYFSPGSGPYGHRLFIPASYEVEHKDNDSSAEAHKLLTELSVWKGFDKRWRINDVVHFGYEFSHLSNNWDETLKQLGEAGFTFKTYDTSVKVEAL